MRQAYVVLNPDGKSYSVYSLKTGKRISKDTDDCVLFNTSRHHLPNSSGVSYRGWLCEAFTPYLLRDIIKRMQEFAKYSPNAFFSATFAHQNWGCLYFKDNLVYGSYLGHPYEKDVIKLYCENQG